MDNMKHLTNKIIQIEFGDHPKLDEKVKSLEGNQILIAKSTCIIRNPQVGDWYYDNINLKVEYATHEIGYEQQILAFFIAKPVQTIDYEIIKGVL